MTTIPLNSEKQSQGIQDAPVARSHGGIIQCPTCGIRQQVCMSAKAVQATCLNGHSIDLNPQPHLPSPFVVFAEDGTFTRAGRCNVCGWPLAQRREDGCVPGNCCQRPAPRGDADTPVVVNTPPTGHAVSRQYYTSWENSSS